MKQMQNLLDYKRPTEAKVQVPFPPTTATWDCSYSYPYTGLKKYMIFCIVRSFKCNDNGCYNNKKLT